MRSCSILQYEYAYRRSNWRVKTGLVILFSVLFAAFGGGAIAYSLTHHPTHATVCLLEMVACTILGFLSGKGLRRDYQEMVRLADYLSES